MTIGHAYDHLIKLLLIGDSGVGKSSVLLRFVDDVFTPSFISTIGIDFKIKTLTIDEKRYKLQIWDTAGQERFRSITTAYYRGAMGVFIIYDITNLESFEHVKDWLSGIEKSGTPDSIKFLVGNKTDMDTRRIISIEQGQQLADIYQIGFSETSAKTNHNIDHIFLTVSKLIAKKLNPTPILPPPITIIEAKSSRTCCN